MNKVKSIIYKIRTLIKRFFCFINPYWLLLFYFLFFCFNELVYTIRRINGINSDFLFPVLFSLSFGLLLFVITGIFSKKVNKIVSICLTSFYTGLYDSVNLFSNFQGAFVCIFSGGCR